MLPDSICLISETAVAPTSYYRSVNDSPEAFTPKSPNSIDAGRLTPMTSSYLHRIPSGSTQWERYLEDLLESKAKRARRAKREQESVTEFLQRFPILEST